MTLAEFERALGSFLFEKWLAEVGWDRETLRGFFEHGIPADYAKVISDMTEGRLPASLWPKLLHPPKLLHSRKQSSSVNVTDMTPAHRMAISQGRERDRFQKAANKAGFTQNSLAERLGVSKAALSRYRTTRPVPKALKDKIEELTGFAGPWPAGIVSDD